MPGDQPARRAIRSEAPSVHIAAPDTCGILASVDGRLARPALAMAAQRVTTTSAAVLSATEMVPRLTYCRATSAAGSINCGMKARKNAAVVGFSASTIMPC